MRWVCGSTRDPPVRQEDVAAVHAAHNRGQHRVDASAEGVQEAGRKARKGSMQGWKCAPLLAQVATCKEGRKCLQMCKWALKQKQTLGRRRTPGW